MKLSIIIPCYFNEENLPDTFTELLQNEQSYPAGCEVEYVLVDDGSGDNTLNELLKFKQANPDRVKIVKLSGNFGSYPALLAGCHFATGDCCVQLHADLQDPPQHIAEMIALWQKGFKLVIGNRVNREGSAVNHVAPNLYHYLIKKFALNNIPEGGYDLVLFDKEIKEHLVKMNESNINLIYLISWMKHAYAAVPVVRRERKKGSSRWTFSNKVKLFIDSFVGFSYAPIRAISLFTMLSFLVFLFVTAKNIWQLLRHKIKVGHCIKQITIYLLVFGAFYSLSVIAEYLYRTLEAARKRPPFIIDKVY